MSGRGGAWRRAASRLATLSDHCVRWLEGAPLERRAWIGEGVALPLLVPLLVALPLALSGPVRVVLGCPLVLALMLAIAPAAVAAVPVVLVARARRGHRAPIAAYALPLAIGFGSCFLLYRRAFAGLTNYAGGDAGEHASIVDLFAHVGSSVYQAFVSMHAMAYWIETLTRTNVFWGLCSTYYFGVAVVAAVPCMIASAALSPQRPHAWAYRAGVATCAVASAVIAYCVVLPQQHYHETDGFLSHLFGLVPLVLLWLVDATVHARLWRWSGVLFAALLYRYTYGLNFGELLVALAAVLFADSFGVGVPAGPRWLLRVTPFAAVVASRSVYAMLVPLLSLFGWFIPYDVPTVLAAQAFGIGALVVLAFAARSDETVLRLFRFPVVFAALNALATHRLALMRPRQPYYLYKFPIHGVVLLASAAVVGASVAVALAVRALSDRRRRWRVPLGVVSLALLVLAFARWRAGYAPFQPTFRERVWGHAPFTTARPLADLHAWSDIDAILEREHKKFGGYITSYWPMFNFMNAGLGYYNGGRSFWVYGGVRDAPGYCVFWDRGRVDWWSTPNDLTQALQSSVGMLERRTDRACVTYRAAWNHDIQRTLCHVCNAGER